MVKKNKIILKLPQSKDFKRNFRNNFNALNIHLWAHFVGFQCKSNDIFKFIASVTLLLTAEIINSLCTIKRLQFEYRIHNNIEKSQIVLAVQFSLEFLLRILLYRNRRKFSVIHLKLSKMYYIVSGKTSSYFQKRIALILLISDFTNIGITLYHVIVNNFPFPPNNVFYAGLRLLWNWNSMSVTIPAYFVCYCYILIEILDEMKKQLLCKNSNNAQHFYAVYDKINNLIIFINEIFHFMLLITFAILLGWEFYDTYLLIFTKLYRKMEILLLLILITSLRIIAMCCFSSFVSKLSAEVKDLVFRIPSDITPFILNLQNKVSSFTLLDTYVTGKNLIVTFIGSLLTYGILIATLSENF